MILKSYVQYRVSSSVEPVDSTVHVDNVTISGDGSSGSPLKIKDGYLDAKQDTLVSGTNIKTINGNSVLGSGDIVIESGGGTWGSIEGNIQDQTDLIARIDQARDEAITAAADDLAPVAADLAAHIANDSNPHNVTKAQVGLSSVDNTSDLDKPVSTATQAAIDAKQDTLVSGTNIKTVNGNSLLGSGDVAITAPDASETVKGIVELATTAEVLTGTDTARAVTPAGTKAAIDEIRNKLNIGGMGLT